MISCINKINIGFAFGAKAIEHDLSVKSALYLMAYIDRQKYNCVSIYIKPNGMPAESAETRRKLVQILDHSPAPIFTADEPIPLDFRQWIMSTIPSKFEFSALKLLDIVFPVFHGQNGEDAIFQGLLEFMNIPYIGCGITGSTIGNDKELNKRICLGHGIPVTDFYSFKYNQWLEQPQLIMRHIESTLGFPVFIKPPCLGSSIGITKAYSPASLEAGIIQVLAYGDKVLVERPVNGKEYGIGLIGNEAPQVSELVEFGTGEDFQDYAAKYGPNACVDIIPAPLEQSLKQRLIAMSRKIYTILDLCGMSRIDFFIEGRNILFNEANTVPGFGKNSVFSKIWAASGISLPSLIDQLVNYGFQRSQYRQNLKYNII